MCFIDWLRNYHYVWFAKRLLQTFPQFEFERSYLSYYFISVHKFGIIGKLVYTPLHWYDICYGFCIMECALHPNMGQSHKWHVAKCIDFVNMIYHVIGRIRDVFNDVEAIMHDVNGVLSFPLVDEMIFKWSWIQLWFLLLFGQRKSDVCSVIVVDNWQTCGNSV